MDIFHRFSSPNVCEYIYIIVECIIYIYNNFYIFYINYIYIYLYINKILSVAATLHRSELQASSTG